MNGGMKKHPLNSSKKNIHILISMKNPSCDAIKTKCPKIMGLTFRIFR